MGNTASVENCDPFVIFLAAIYPDQATDTQEQFEDDDETWDKTDVSAVASYAQRLRNKRMAELALPRPPNALAVEHESAILGMCWYVTLCDVVIDCVHACTTGCTAEEARSVYERSFRDNKREYISKTASQAVMDYGVEFAVMQLWLRDAM